MLSGGKNSILRKVAIRILGSLFYSCAIGISAQTLELTDGKFSNNLLLGDTSFETGIHPIVTGALRWGELPFNYAEIDKTTAVDGKQSLKLPISNIVNTMSFGCPIALASGETYTFSFCAKSQKAGKGIIKFQALDWQDVKMKGLALSPEWKRYSITIKAKQKFYFPILSSCGTEAVWIDCLQLEKGEKSTPYQNGEPVTVNINFEGGSKRIFLSGEKIKAQLVVRKLSSDPIYKDISVKYKITDACHTDIVNERISVLFDGKENTFTKDLILPSAKLGTFLVSYQSESGNRAINTQTSDTYAVINPPVKIRDGLDSFCGYDARETTPQNLKEAGVKWTQIIEIWNSVEKEKGKFDWEEMDAVIASLRKNGFQIKAILGFKIPKWACEPLDQSIKDQMSPAEIKRSQHDTLPSDLDDWRNFVRKFTERYHDKIDLYEIGAEADLAIGDNPYYRIKYPEFVKGRFLCGGPVIDKYGRMIEIAAEEIRKLNSDAKIGAVRPSNVDCDAGFPFTTAVFEKAGKYLNRLPMDPYTGPRLIGKDRIETRDPEYLENIFKNATELAEKCGGQKLYVSELTWYHDITEGFMSESAEKGTRKIIRSALISKMTPGMVYWHLMGGNSIYCRYTNHMFIWGFYPTLLVPAYSMLAQVAENVKSVKEIKFNQRVKAAVFEKDNCATATIWSIDNDRKILEISPLEGLEALDMIGNPVKTEIKNNKLNIPFDGNPVYFILEGNASADKLFQTLSQGKIRGVPVKVNFRPVGVQEGEISVENMTDNRLKGTIRILVDAQPPLEISANIPVAESKTFKFPICVDSENIRTVKTETNFPGEDNVCGEFRTEPFIKCKKVSFPVKVDGDMKEWENQPFIAMNKRTQIEPSDPWIPWAGPEHFGAKVYTGWDDNALYIAVEVTDDKHFNKQKGKRIWNGDGIQIAFDFGNDATLHDTLGYDDNDMDFMIALTDSGISSNRLPEEAKLAIVRNGNKTCYELSIPRSALPDLLTLKPGSVTGFNFLIYNDNDGAGQTHYYYLSRGIVQGKDPRLFKKMVLTE